MSPRKGDKIYCPRRHVIGVARKDLAGAQLAGSIDWEPPHKEPAVLSQVQTWGLCVVCGERWVSISKNGYPEIVIYGAANGESNGRRV